MARHDPANTGFNPKTVGPTRGVSKRWRVNLGRFAFAAPIVDDDLV